MALLDGGQLRKRWRYVAVFGEEVMLCAARAQVGPFAQSFWVLRDRGSGRQWGHVSLRPGSREVAFEGRRLELDADGMRARLELGGAAPIEARCASGRSWAWTRKRAGLPIEGTVEVPGRRWRIDGRGVEDESAGYHRRHTSWRWSAGVGRSTDGRDLAWNLVEGINDPPRGSERAIWVDGAPREPAPVAFSQLAAIDLGDGGRLEFAPESDHARDENYLVVRSRYRHRFGTFSGTLAGHQLGEGLGVMEEHDALW